MPVGLGLDADASGEVVVICGDAFARVGLAVSIFVLENGGGPVEGIVGGVEGFPTVGKGLEGFSDGRKRNDFEDDD